MRAANKYEQELPSNGELEDESDYMSTCLANSYLSDPKSLAELLHKITPELIAKAKVKKTDMLDTFIFKI